MLYGKHCLHLYFIPGQIWGGRWGSNADHTTSPQQDQSHDVKERRLTTHGFLCAHTHTAWQLLNRLCFLLFLSVIGHDRCPLPPTQEKQMPQRIKAPSALTSCSASHFISSTPISRHTLFLGSQSTV